MPNLTALVTGADRGLGHAITKRLLTDGFSVYAGQFLPEWPFLGALASRFPDLLTLVPLDVSSDASVRAAAATVATTTDHLDLIINNAGITSPSMYASVREPQDYAEMMRMYQINALGPLRVVEAFLPLTDAGRLKRLCFVSSEAGSIARCRRDAWHGYCISKAALNMNVKILHNRLYHEGYTFRLYHPGWMRTWMSGAKSEQGDLEPEEAAIPALAYFLGDQPEEARLRLQDWEGNEWPW